MRRILLFILTGVLITGGLQSGAHAVALISIAGDSLIDVSVRDADRADVLSALFTETTSTANKHILLLKDAVNGHIDRLQLVQVSFDAALSSVLGKDYCYERVVSQGVVTYRVSLIKPVTSSTQVAAPPATHAAATPPPTSQAAATPPKGATTREQSGPMLRITTSIDNNTAAPGGNPNGVATDNNNPSANPNGPTAQATPQGPSLLMNQYYNASGNLVRQPVMGEPYGDGYIMAVPGTNNGSTTYYYYSPQYPGIPFPISPSTTGTPAFPANK